MDNLTAYALLRSMSKAKRKGWSYDDWNYRVFRFYDRGPVKTSWRDIWDSLRREQW